MKGWTVIFAGFLLNLMLGIVYAWSVFVRPLMESFGWSKTVASLPFSIFLLIFAIMMVPAGRTQDRIGPRKVAMLGGVLLGLGFILSSFIDTIRNPAWLLLTYGVIAGAGCGLGYACPIPVARKWYPHRVGLATGLVVMGFGMSALIFAPLERAFIDAYGIGNAFLYIGVILLVVSVIAASLLRNPPESVVQVQQNPVVVSERDYGPIEMLKTPQFWMLWFSFMFMALVGLMVIGHIAPYAQERGLDPYAAAFAASALAVANALGRPGAGWLSDVIGRPKTMFLLFLLQGLVVIAFPHFALALATIYLGAVIVGFNYGANFSLFPSATGDFYGTRNLGVNYGLVFTSYGVGGLVGPIMAGYVFDVTGSYEVAFLVAGVLAIIAAIISLALRPPK